MKRTHSLSRIVPAFLAGLLALGGGCKDPSHSRGSSSQSIWSEAGISAREAATATTVGTDPERKDVVVIGGLGADGSPLADVSIVGAGDAVRAGPSLAEGRARHAAVAIQGGTRIAVIGGVGVEGALESTIIYDPSAGPSPGPDLPAPVVDPRAVLFDDAIFIIGGRRADGSPSDAVLRWTLSSPDPIAQVATLTYARAGHTATLAGGRIWVVGGENETGVLSSVDVIDPATDARSDGPALPAGRTRHAAAALGDGAAVLIAGGLGADGAPLDSGLVLSVAATPAISDAGRFGPAAFDLLALPLTGGNAIVLGGFTALEDGSAVRPSKEAALLVFDAASASGSFIDLPDADPGNGLGAPAGDVRPGNSLGDEGAGESLVLAGGRGSGGDLRGGRIYNPYTVEAARANDLTARFGSDRALVGATLVGIFGVIERTREYYGERHREIDIERVEDAVRGTVVRGEIGEWDVDLELDSGVIRGKAAGTSFTVFIRGDELRGDGVSVDLRAAPDESVEGRYYLSWKKNSVLVQVWRLGGDRPFEGRIASDDPNLVIEVAAGGGRTDASHSYFDNREIDLSGSR
jgi:hypothetical protein